MCLINAVFLLARPLVSLGVFFALRRRCGSSGKDTGTGDPPRADSPSQSPGVTETGARQPRVWVKASHNGRLTQFLRVRLV